MWIYRYRGPFDTYIYREIDNICVGCVGYVCVQWCRDCLSLKEQHLICMTSCTKYIGWSFSLHDTTTFLRWEWYGHFERTEKKLSPINYLYVWHTFILYRHSDSYVLFILSICMFEHFLYLDRPFFPDGFFSVPNHREKEVCILIDSSSTSLRAGRLWDPTRTRAREREEKPPQNSIRCV